MLKAAKYVQNQSYIVISYEVYLLHFSNKSLFIAEAKWRQSNFPPFTSIFLMNMLDYIVAAFCIIFNVRCSLPIVTSTLHY